MSPVDTDLAARVLALEGGCNFRDFGGYRTQDGYHVRRGLLFRSGVMAHFTAADAHKVRALGIRSIIDLRREKEREKEPTRWTDAGVEVVFRDHPQDAAALKWITMDAEQTAATAKDALIALYRTMPEWLATRMRDLFERLAGIDAPLLLHCSAGKDRTGFGAALVLEALGVPRETVLQDYALTNTAVDLEAFVLRHHDAGMGLTDAEHPLLSVLPDARAAMLAADPDYLLATLARIDQEFGGVTAYVQNQLGIDDDALQQLRARLLVKP